MGDDKPIIEILVRFESDNYRSATVVPIYTKEEIPEVFTGVLHALETCPTDRARIETRVLTFGPEANALYAHVLEEAKKFVEAKPGLRRIISLPGQPRN